MVVRKIHNLQKKLAEKKGQEKVKVDIELILDESHPQYHWDDETWQAYIEWEALRGNEVILLTGDE